MRGVGGIDIGISIDIDLFIDIDIDIDIDIANAVFIKSLCRLYSSAIAGL